MILRFSKTNGSRQRAPTVPSAGPHYGPSLQVGHPESEKNRQRASDARLMLAKKDTRSTGGSIVSGSHPTFGESVSLQNLHENYHFKEGDVG